MAQALPDDSLAADAAVREVVRFGAFIIIAVFGGLLAWSIFFPIAGAVVASGTIQVEGSRKTVQHLEGGIVKALHVKEGDAVKAGAVLIELDETAAQSGFNLVDSQLVELYARRARLEAERDSAADVALPQELASRAGEPAVQQALGGQLSLFHDRMLGAESRANILNQRIAEFQEQINGTEAQAASKDRQVALLSKELSGLRKLYEKGYAPLTRILALERESERLTGETGEAHAQIASLKNSIGETQSQILKDKQDHQEQILSELRDVEAEIGKDLPQRVATADALHRVSIVAPVSGRVLNLAVHTTGGVVTPAMALMDIVPENDNLVVLAQVRPVDVDKIIVGTNVNVRLAAFSPRRTPTVDGKILSVSPDRIVDERTGRAFYQAKVSLPARLPPSFGGEPLRPGMPAEVFVHTHSQTAVGYLLRPLTDAFARTFRED